MHLRQSKGVQDMHIVSATSFIGHQMTACGKPLATAWGHLRTFLIHSTSRKAGDLAGKD
jgi:hypothetical protein